MEIPKGPLVLFIGGVALLMLITGIVKKQNDLSVFGLFMGAVLAIASSYMPDDIAIRYYSLLFVGVFLGGYALLNWQIRRGGGPEETAGDFIVYGVLAVLIGARLGHVLFYDLDKALEDPLWTFQIWTGGLASHGAVIGLIAAMWLFTKRRGVPFLEGADRFAFSAALGATLVRLGNFFNSEIVGREVPDQSWGVRFPRHDVGVLNPPLRYPTQLFEVALGLFVILCLYLVDRAAGKEKRPRGLLISTFFFVYFIGRFVVEFWKTHQTVEETAYITMGQYLSIPGILIGIYGLIWALKTKQPVGWPNPGAEPVDEDEDEDEDEDDDDDLADEDEEEKEDDAGERTLKSHIAPSTTPSTTPSEQPPADGTDEEKKD